MMNTKKKAKKRKHNELTEAVKLKKIKLGNAGISMLSNENKKLKKHEKNGFASELIDDNFHDTATCGNKRVKKHKRGYSQELILKQEVKNTQSEVTIHNETNIQNIETKKRKKKKKRKKLEIKMNDEINETLLSNLENSELNSDTKKHKKKKKNKSETNNVITTNGQANNNSQIINTETLENSELSTCNELKKQKKQRRNRKPVVNENGDVLLFNGEGKETKSEDCKLNKENVKVIKKNKRKHSAQISPNHKVKAERNSVAIRFENTVVGETSKSCTQMQKFSDTKFHKQHEKNASSPEPDLLQINNSSMPTTSKIQDDIKENNFSSDVSDFGDDEQQFTGSAFADRFNQSLSQAQTETVITHEEGDNHAQYKSASFDYHSTKVKRCQARYVPLFKKRSQGGLIEVQYTQAEKVAQNHAFCHNIISYNRDVNSLLMAYKKLDTPAFRYCSEEPSDDIFISDVEISDEDEEEQETDSTKPFVRFTKSSQKKHSKIKLFHPPPDFHP